MRLSLGKVLKYRTSGMKLRFYSVQLRFKMVAGLSSEEHFKVQSPQTDGEMLKGP